MYGQYERPPFPIKIDMPNNADVLREMRFSDVFMAGSIYGTGIVWGYFASRSWPLIAQRLTIYHAVSHMALVFGLSSMYAVSYRRLTGYWDNGLRWKVPEDRFRKFDNTSVFEANTMFKRFRIRSDE